MAADILVPIAALCLIALTLLAATGFLVLRRVVITRSIGTFECALKVPDRDGTSWVLGVARYEADRLDWFRVLTINPRPERSLARDRLLILERRRPEGDQRSPLLLPGWVVVRCSYQGAPLEMAMGEPSYSALATWLESAPPGQHISVA